MTQAAENTPIKGKNSKNNQIAIKAFHRYYGERGLDISNYDPHELSMGIEVEQEHNGTMGSDVDVVPGNDPVAIMKIVIAHMREDPKYYTKLRKMESEGALRTITTLIESKKATVQDFNIFLESLPKSTDERLARYSRLDKNFHDKQPGKQADDATDRDGDNNPLKTLRGKLSVRRQARDNKQHPDRFKEAIEFVRANHGRPVEELKEEIDTIRDKTALLALITRILGRANINLNPDWFKDVKGVAEGKDAIRSR